MQVLCNYLFVLSIYVHVLKDERLPGNIDQTFVNSLYGLRNFETGGLDCVVTKTTYISRVHLTHYFVMH